jgi:hypothetical protein
MVRTTLAAAVLLTSCGAGSGETPLAHKTQLLAYENCVVGHAKSFAGSPDSTENITRSALRSCASERHALSEALTRAGVSPAELAASLNAFDQQVSQTASSAIIEERAAH